MATVTGPVLPGTPSGPHLPPQPPSSPALRERKGEYETSDGRYVARPSPPTLRERKGEYETSDSRYVIQPSPPTLRERKGKVGVESYVPDEKSLRDALEQGGDGCRAGAARYAWWPSPSPPAPFLSRTAGEEGGV